MIFYKRVELKKNKRSLQKLIEKKVFYIFPMRIKNFFTNTSASSRLRITFQVHPILMAGPSDEIIAK